MENLSNNQKKILEQNIYQIINYILDDYNFKKFNNLKHNETPVIDLLVSDYEKAFEIICEQITFDLMDKKELDVSFDSEEEAKEYVKQIEQFIKEKINFIKENFDSTILKKIFLKNLKISKNNLKVTSAFKLSVNFTIENLINLKVQGESDETQLNSESQISDETVVDPANLTPQEALNQLDSPPSVSALNDAKLNETPSVETQTSTTIQNPFIQTQENQGTQQLESASPQQSGVPGVPVSQNQTPQSTNLQQQMQMQQIQLQQMQLQQIQQQMQSLSSQNPGSAGNPAVSGANALDWDKMSRKEKAKLSRPQKKAYKKKRKHAKFIVWIWPFLIFVILIAGLSAAAGFYFNFF